MSSRATTLTLILLAGFALCYLGFINGFPLLFPDTGTYLRSGFENEVPIDRPIFYGLFARHVSLHETLWLVILVQGIMLSALIYRLYRIYLPPARRKPIFLITIAALTVTTGVSYYVSMVIPDIFTAILFLSGFILLFDATLRWWSKVGTAILFVASLMFHLSHIPILLGTMAIVGILVLIARWKKRPVHIRPRPAILIASLTLGTLLLIPTLNWLFGSDFALSRGSQTFTMARLNQIGVLKQFLKEACPHPDYRICAYKDNLPWDLLWEPNSPLALEGGWEATRPEYQQIVSEIMRQPQYLKTYFRFMIEDGSIQLFSIEMEPLVPVLYESPVFPVLHQYFRTSVRSSISSRQTNHKLNFSRQNSMQDVLYVLSWAVIVAFLFVKTWAARLPKSLWWLLCLLAIYGVLNAFISAGMSCVSPRYMGRIAWMYPMVASLAGWYVLEAIGFWEKAKRWWQSWDAQA